MYKIFISYRRDDSEWVAGRIFDRLESQFGRDTVFMDVATIPLGVDFRAYFHDAIGKCDVLLALIGDRWLNITFESGPLRGKRRLDHPQDFVCLEISAALARNIPVIPILIGNVSVPDKDQLPQALQDLAYRNALEFRESRRFHHYVNELIQGIEKLRTTPSLSTFLKINKEPPDVSIKKFKLCPGCKKTIAVNKKDKDKLLMCPYCNSRLRARKTVIAPSALMTAVSVLATEICCPQCRTMNETGSLDCVLCKSPLTGTSPGSPAVSGKVLAGTIRCWFCDADNKNEASLCRRCLQVLV